MKKINLFVKRIKKALQLAGLSIAFAMAAILSFTLPAMADDHPTLAIGSPAPDFSLKGVDGKMYSLKDFSKAKILVIVFTCDHCPTAQAYEDSIKMLTADYKSKGVAFVAISPNDSKSIRLDEMGYTDLGDSYEDMQLRAKEKNFNYPYLYDGATSETAMKYGPQSTPHVFIFDKDRILRYTGRIDDGLGGMQKAMKFDTKDALDELLAGQPVKVEKTKTFGCSIKWPAKHDLVNQEAAGWAREPVTITSLDIDSAKVMLANNTQNFKLINLWATWCGPCVTEFPGLVDINRMYRLREFEFITVSMDDTARRANALNFLVKKEASGKNYLFVGDKYKFIDQVDKNWEGSLPYTLLIGPGGKVLYSKQGAVDPLELKQAIMNAMGRGWMLPEKYIPKRD